MNIRRVRAIALKEARHILRDRRSLAAAFFIPTFLLVVFGWALNFDVDRLDTAVLDHDHTPESRDFIARMSSNRFFRVRYYPDHPRELERLLLSGEAVLAVTLPRGFGGELLAGRNAVAGIAVDGSDANRASIALGYLQALAGGFSRESLLNGLRGAGIKHPQPPLKLEQRVWYNEELESKNYIVPGLIAVIMTVIAAMLTSLTIAREWERGTMEQLISTPVRGPEILLGKLIPYLGIGALELVLTVAMAILVFGVPFRGSFLLLAVTSLLFLWSAMTLGLLISVVGKSQLVANQMSMLIAFLPAFLLSGFAFAIENMPLVLQGIAHLFPATYFVHGVKAIFLKGSGIALLKMDLACLVLYGAALFTLARLKFRKRLI